MKLYLLACTLVLFACSKAQLPVTPAQETTASLEVITIQENGVRIDSAQVYLNGNFSGVTPFKRGEVPGGLMTLRIMKGGFKMHTEQVFITDGEAHSLEVILYPVVSNQATAPSLEFVASPDTVQLGEAIILNWQSNGYEVIIDQGIGTRGPNGSERVECASAGLKIFTATSYNEDELFTQKSDSVYVQQAEIFPPTLAFSVLQDSIEFGQEVTIEWVTNGYQVIMDQGVGVRGPSGTEEVAFQNPGKKVFTATAYGQNNLTVIKYDSVFVKPAQEPELPVLLLSTTRQVNVDSVARIKWYTKNADYIVVDYVSNPELYGMEEVRFSTSGTRIVTATAYNRAGYVSARDTIEVVEPQVSSVDDIIVPANTSVRADQGESGYKDLSAGTFVVQTPGKYRLTAEVWYNSGDSQQNESYYLLLHDQAGVTAAPQDPNAGTYRVIPDDPGEPHMKSQESGVFTLPAGNHTIEVYHYAKIANAYPQFINGQISGPESVKILGFKLVYVDE